MSQQVLYPEDIIKSHTTYGDDFITLDLSVIKENQAKTVKYCSFKIKNDKGLDVVPIIKLINLTVASKIKLPEEREFEQLKIAVRQNDINNKESKFGEAMSLICDTFIKKVKDLKANGIINDDEDDENNSSNVIIVPNCHKIQTPIQKKAKNKEGQNVNLENPMLWFGLNYKRYKADEERQLNIFDNLVYNSDKKPFYIKDFDVDIYDLENIQNGKPQLAVDENNKKINNTNVHKFMTINSLLSGAIYMQVVMSSRSFNLNTKLYKNIYIKSNKNNVNNDNVFDEDDFKMMIGQQIKSTPTIEEKKTVIHEEEVEEDEEESENDEEEDDIDAKLNKLKF